MEEGYEQRIFGLANAYLLAGVRHYVGTFWEVLDETGSYMAEGFYDGLARGESIGEALRKSRHDLVKTYGEEALIWTSYVLYGDPTFCLPLVEAEAVRGASVREAFDSNSIPSKSDGVGDLPSQVARSGYPYVFFSGLLLTLLFAAYFVFYPKAGVEQQKSVLVTPLPSLRSLTLEKGIEIPQKIETTEKPEPKFKKEQEIRMSKVEESRPAEQPAKIPSADVATEVMPSPLLASPVSTFPAVAEAPKYRVGDAWTLRLSDGQTVRRKIRAIENGLYVLECDSNRWQYLDKEFVLRREITPEGKGLYPQLLNQKFLDFPLSLNKSWEFRIISGRSNLQDGAKTFPSYWRRFRYRVTTNEAIETLAGRFGAFKIEERSNEIACDSRCDDIPNTSVIRQLWYAPETRFIVKVTHVSGEPWQGQELDYELISLDLKTGSVSKD